MKINHNMSAVIANNQLLRNENSLSDAVERLSSGLRINHASDDAAGMAIASKMRAQIKGLNQASRNASDGISVLETADGAMNEVTAMLQRMRELSVQAANGIYTQEDLEAIQAEVESLTEEIDRVSTDTEFNTMKLLDGSLDQRVYLDTRNVERVSISDAVMAKNYTINVLQDARQAVLVSGRAIGGATVPAGASGKITINGIEAEIEEGEDIQDVYQKLRDAAETGEVNLFTVADRSLTGGKEECAGYQDVPCDVGTTLVFVSERYGSAAEIKLTCDNADLARYLGICTKATTHGKDAKLNVEDSLGEGFTNQATYTSDGRDMVITDREGFEMSFRVLSGTAGSTFRDPVMAGHVIAEDEEHIMEGSVTNGDGTDVNFEVTEIGTMTLQIGANENQTMEVRIPSISAKNLYIDEVDVTSVTGADRAITTYDKAIAKISESRSRIGAYQNRLEYAVNSLDATEENMTAALSRIEDADMAEEMTTYTQYNVLSQAATSVLAQANDIPQQALQLLQ